MEFRARVGEAGRPRTGHRSGGGGTAGFRGHRRPQCRQDSHQVGRVAQGRSRLIKRNSAEKFGSGRLCCARLITQAGTVAFASSFRLRPVHSAVPPSLCLLRQAFQLCQPSKLPPSGSGTFSQRPACCWHGFGVLLGCILLVWALGANQFLSGGDDEAEVHEYIENCRRTPIRLGEQTLSEPGIWIWTPSSDLAQSRRRASSATEVPGCQWDALKPL